MTLTAATSITPTRAHAKHTEDEKIKTAKIKYRGVEQSSKLANQIFSAPWRVSDKEEINMFSCASWGLTTSTR